MLSCPQDDESDDDMEVIGRKRNEDLSGKQNLGSLLAVCVVCLEIFLFLVEFLILSMTWMLFAQYVHAAWFDGSNVGKLASVCLEAIIAGVWLAWRYANFFYLGTLMQFLIAWGFV